MANLREKGADIFEDLDETVAYEDYMNEDSGLPKADVLKYKFEDGSWVAVRPSGTEPKIKIYYCMRGDSEEAAAERQKTAAACVGKFTGADR